MPHSKINASAVQHFAGQLKADGAFKSVQALRASDEAATSDYVLLHLQALLAEDDARALLTWAKGQERARHPHAPSVKALPSDATLMTIVRTGALDSKPRRAHHFPYYSFEIVPDLIEVSRL